MSYEHIVQFALQTPWAISPEKLTAISSVLVRRMDGERYTDAQIDAVIGERRLERAPYEVEMGSAAAEKIAAAANGGRPAPRGKLMVIPVYGILGPKASQFSQMSGPGGCGIDQLASQFRQAMGSADVRCILFDFDSPGGSVYGIDEFASEIFNARGQGKKIVAQVNPMCASAAYYLASQCDEVVVTPSGEVGSIGVRTMHADFSKQLEARGVKVTHISAGKYKTEGVSEEPLSPDALAYMQQRVDDYYDMFVKAVARGREVKVADVRDGFGQGRMVSAIEAKKAGMVDRIATLDETLSRLGGRVQEPAAVDAVSAAPAPHASPVVQPITTAAAVQKEFPMEPNSQAATAAGTNPDPNAMAALESERVAALSDLAMQNNATAKLAGWLRGRVTLASAQAELLNDLRATHRPAPAAAAPFVESVRDAADKIPGSIRMMRMARCVALSGRTKMSLAEAARVIGDPVLQHGFENGFSAMTPNQGSTVADGGAAIPEVFSQDFIPFLRPKAVVRSFGTRSYPLINGNLKVTKMANGTVAGYVGEANRVAVTKGQLGSLKLSARKLGATLLISNDLLRFQGIQVDEQLRADAARAIAQCEDTAFIRSAGTEWTPKGLYYQADPGNIFPSTITKAQIAASVAAGNVAVLAAVQNDFQVLFSAIANACVPMENMGIIMSKRTEYFFKFGVRDGLGRLVLGEEMEKGTLFGVKYKSTTVIPNNLGAGGIDSEIYLADFDQVVIADAPVVSVQYSQEASVVDPDGVTHNLFQDDLTGIRFIEEHDMGVFYPKAIAVLTGVEYGA